MTRKITFDDVAEVRKAILEVVEQTKPSLTVEETNWILFGAGIGIAKLCSYLGIKFDDGGDPVLN